MTKSPLLLMGILATFSSPPAAAATSSGCFQMTGVVAGDKLNLRAQPNAGARIVLALAPGDAAVIASLGACRSGWCKVAVSTGDGTMRGWIKRRLLKKSGCP